MHVAVVATCQSEWEPASTPFNLGVGLGGVFHSECRLLFDLEETRAIFPHGSNNSSIGNLEADLPCLVLMKMNWAIYFNYYCYDKNFSLKIK
jgi:hypothetical protein